MGRHWRCILSFDICSLFLAHRHGKEAEEQEGLTGDAGRTRRICRGESTRPAHCERESRILPEVERIYRVSWPAELEVLPWYGVVLCCIVITTPLACFHGNWRSGIFSKASFSSLALTTPGNRRRTWIVRSWSRASWKPRRTSRRSRRPLSRERRQQMSLRQKPRRKMWVHSLLPCLSARVLSYRCGPSVRPLHRHFGPRMSRGFESHSWLFASCLSPALSPFPVTCLQLAYH